MSSPAPQPSAGTTPAAETSPNETTTADAGEAVVCLLYTSPSPRDS